MGDTSQENRTNRYELAFYGVILLTTYVISRIPPRYDHHTATAQEEKVDTNKRKVSLLEQATRTFIDNHTRRQE